MKRLEIVKVFNFLILMKILLNFKLILKRMLEIELKTNILVKKSKLIKDILTDF